MKRSFKASLILAAILASGISASAQTPEPASPSADGPAIGSAEWYDLLYERTPEEEAEEAEYAAARAAFADRLRQDRLAREQGRASAPPTSQYSTTGQIAPAAPLARPVQTAQNMEWSQLVDTAGRCTIALNSPMQAQDVSVLYKRFDSGANESTKSPYETQEQYETRRRTTSTSSTAVVAGFGFERMSYDPEAEHFIIRDRDIRQYYKHYGLRKYILIRDAREKVGVLTTSGGWGGINHHNIVKGDVYYLDGGASVDTGDGNSTELGAYFSMFAMDTGMDTEKNFILLKMDRETARQNHGYLKTAFVITPGASPTSHTEVDSLSEYNDYTINGEVHCALVLDRNNRVVRVVHKSTTPAGSKRRPSSNGLLGTIGRGILGEIIK
ncbi:MAG: hypothetical protein V3U82_01380 [Robiginitomaculum sp.]